MILKVTVEVEVTDDFPPTQWKNVRQMVEVALEQHLGKDYKESARVTSIERKLD